MPKKDNDKSAEDLFPSKELRITEKESIHFVEAGHDSDIQWEEAYQENSYDFQILENIKQAKQKERYCFFLDIDGTLLKHYGDKPEQFEDKIEVLPGVREFFQLCGKNGHVVILTSGRRESFRETTKRQLKNACIPYDKLILGCTNAIRVLVNDTKPYREDSP